MIAIESIHVLRDKTHILKDVSLEVRAGELIALLGPSGAGKSTLLRAIAGLQPVSKGHIGFYSENKPKVSMVFQDYALFPHLNVEENLKAALNDRSAQKNGPSLRDEFIVRILRIRELLQRFPHEISAGQRQRVGLARALLVSPQVVLLDEPFANLDEQTKKDLNAGLRAILLRRNISAILVTHDFDEAQIFADRVAVLMSGEILQIDRPELVYHAPANRAVGELIGPLNRIEASLEAEGNNAPTVFGTVPVYQAVHKIDNRVELFVRPEDFVLKDNGAEGVVCESVFRGDDSTLAVEFDGVDRRVLIRQFWPQSYKAGQRVRVGLKKRPYAAGPILV